MQSDEKLGGCDWTLVSRRSGVYAQEPIENLFHDGLRKFDQLGQGVYDFRLQKKANVSLNQAFSQSEY